ncbi:MAG TPA: hypothetical protein VF033_03650 [Steroidobacteraceae bacterium]
MSRRNHIPCTVDASLEARLAPFPAARRAILEDLDVEASRAVTPDQGRPLSLLPSLKLLIASLGAGNSVVPMGDNGHAARLLSEYAKSLQTN